MNTLLDSSRFQVRSCFTLSHQLNNLQTNSTNLGYLDFELPYGQCPLEWNIILDVPQKTEKAETFRHMDNLRYNRTLWYSAQVTLDWCHFELAPCTGHDILMQVQVEPQGGEKLPGDSVTLGQWHRLTAPK